MSALSVLHELTDTFFLVSECFVLCRRTIPIIDAAVGDALRVESAKALSQC